MLSAQEVMVGPLENRRCPGVAALSVALSLSLMSLWAQPIVVDALGPVSPSSLHPQITKFSHHSPPPELPSTTTLTATYRFPPPTDVDFGSQPKTGHRILSRAVPRSALEHLTSVYADNGKTPVLVGSITSPGAAAIRLHFTEFDVGTGQVWVTAVRDSETEYLG